MSEIKRYRIDPIPVGPIGYETVEDPSGMYVLRSDHAEEVARLRAERDEVARKVAFYEESLCLDAGPMRALYGGGVTREIAPEKVYAILDERATLRAEVDALKAERDAATKKAEWTETHMHRMLALARRGMEGVHVSYEFGGNAPEDVQGFLDEAFALHERLTRLQSEKSAAVEVLRGLEWNDECRVAEDDYVDSCPWCGQMKRDGHKSDCALAAALSGGAA